ncbi:MAG: hypothetical protein ACYC26_06715, partial [Phycisphaerales bacterium]
TLFSVKTKSSTPLFHAANTVKTCVRDQRLSGSVGNDPAMFFRGERGERGDTEARSMKAKQRNIRPH